MIHTYNVRTLSCIYNKYCDPLGTFFSSLLPLHMFHFGNACKLQCRSHFHCLCFRNITGEKFSCDIVYVLKVPELAGFWLLSILLQFPLILFQLFNEAILIQPLERAVHIVLALLILVQVGVEVKSFIKLACDCQWLNVNGFIEHEFS